MPIPNLVSIKLNMSDFTHLQRRISWSFPMFFPHQWLNANLHEIHLAQNQQSNGKSCIREKIMMETYGRSLFSSPLDLTVHLCSLPCMYQMKEPPYTQCILPIRNICQGSIICSNKLGIVCMCDLFLDSFGKWKSRKNIKEIKWYCHNYFKYSVICLIMRC